MLENKIKNAIREVPDFPQKGILYKDITPVLMDPGLCTEITDSFFETYSKLKIDAVAAIESRGFLFGFLLANRLQVPFALIRKSGKLPWKTISREYELEYGTATVEMHTDAIEKGWNVLVHDDLLATGGTAKAAAELIEMKGGKVAGFSFLIELGFLNGKNKIKKYSENITSLANYY